RPSVASAPPTVIELPTDNPCADEVVSVTTFALRAIRVTLIAGVVPQAGGPRLGAGVTAKGSLVTGCPTSGHPAGVGVVEFANESGHVTPPTVTVLLSWVSQPPTTRIAGAVICPPGPKMSKASWLVSPWLTRPLHESA